MGKRKSDWQKKRIKLKIAKNILLKEFTNPLFLGTVLIVHKCFFIERRIILKKKSILFYVLAVIFLVIAIYMGVGTYLTLAASAAQYEISLVDEWSTVLQNIIAAAGGFLAFAFIFCGIAFVLGDLSKIINEPVTLKKRKSKRDENAESKKAERIS